MKRLDLEFISSHSDKEKLFASLLDNNEMHLCISYISDFKSAKVLRESIDNICKLFDITPKWRTRLVLIIDELNNNAIEYGSEIGDTNILELHIEKRQDQSIHLLVKVSDTGAGKSSKNAKDMEKMRLMHENKDFTEHHSIRGRGLFLIISHLVDSLSFSDNSEGGLTVGIEKKLEGK